MGNASKAMPWIVTIGISAGVLCAQNTGSSHGMPMPPPPPADTSRIQQEMSNHGNPGGPLKISYGSKSAAWDTAKLAALPHTTVTAYNEHAKANQTFSGVPLIDLLAQLGVPAKPKGKDFRLYILAEGSDGYQVVYSIGEVTPDAHDGTVLVADSMDGKPISSNGPLQLVVTGEKRPARWIRNLVLVRVQTAQ